MVVNVCVCLCVLCHVYNNVRRLCVINGVYMCINVKRYVLCVCFYRLIGQQVSHSADQAEQARYVRLSLVHTDVLCYFVFM